jgi:peptidoglycan/LPS O-acetylase OafA/YrhL
MQSMEVVPFTHHQEDCMKKRLWKVLLAFAVVGLIAGAAYAQTTAPTTAPPFISAAQVTFLIAGLIGGGLKALASSDQVTWSKKSAIDVVIGGAAAVLIPQMLPSLIPSGVNLFGQGVVVLIASYVSSDIIQQVVGRVGGSTPKV